MHVWTQTPHRDIIPAMLRHRSFTVYLWITGLRSFLFWTAFITGSIYYIRMVGLDPLQLVLVGTVLELTCFCCEIPTGVIADVYSRKLSIIIGFVVIGIGFIIQGAMSTFTAILVAQVFFGSGWTFISGAEDAWLADEIGNDQLAHAYLRGKQVTLAASFLGIFSSVALASLALNVPFLVSGVGLIVVAFALIRWMTETNFQPAAASERGDWQKMKRTFADGIRTIRVSPLLLMILVITLAYGVSREGIDRLWEAHVLSAVIFPALGGVTTIVWFGMINAIAMLGSLALSFILQRWIRVLKGRETVFWLIARYALLALALVLFALTRSFVWVVASYVAIYTLREVGDAVQSAWINRNIDSRSRATVLSTISQMDALGQGGGGPILGAIGVRIGLRASMLAASALLAPVIGLLVRVARRRPE
jgi:MFS transporter, DHA3 family, tetracycline resistance protein